jgi:hypothetical protein
VQRSHSNTHLVVTGGRRPRWTQIYLTRLQNTLGPELSRRLHMIERVSSEQFPALLKIADVILHPFPFDGSKTSADALEVHKPLVTLPTEYLRGRMGAAFLRTMNLPELVARNRSEYVDIAVRLSQDAGFYDQMVGLITERVDLIWEDMSVPYAWTQLLCGLTGSPAPTWGTFLASSGRDTEVEQRRAAARDSNARLFDETWGPESWLLQEGVATLESMLEDPRQLPCIFQDWNCSSGVVRGDVVAAGQLSQRGNSHENMALDSSEQLTESPLVPYTVDSDGAIIVADADLHKLAAVRGNYLQLCNDGDFSAALTVAQRLYMYYAHLPQYLVEVGLIHIFLGNHTAGVHYCKQAEQLAPPASLIPGCIGLGGMYLPELADETIHAFRTALRLKAEERQRVRDYLDLQTQHRSGEETSPAELEVTSMLEEAAGVMTSGVFSLPVYALENNLLTSFRVNQRYAQCVDWIADVNALPGFLDGATWVLAFATVRWSPSTRPYIDELERGIRQRGEFSVPLQVTLWNEIRRVQESSLHMLTVALECLQGLQADARHPDYLHEALSAITQIMLRLEAAEQTTAMAATTATATSAPTVNDQALQTGVVLILQPYITDTAKAQDINVALWRNLQNPHITDIYVLTEVHMNFAGFPHAHKIHQVVIGERLTFKRAFEFANENLVGRTVVLGE